MDLQNVLTTEQLYGVLRAGFTLVLGFAAAHLLRSAMGSVLDRRTSAQHAMLGRKIAYYVVVALAFASALRELGLNLGVLLGAAGVVTVAMGFAAQTSASNLISGLFLMSEGPFVVGEVISGRGHDGRSPFDRPALGQAPDVRQPLRPRSQRDPGEVPDHEHDPPSHPALRPAGGCRLRREDRESARGLDGVAAKNPLALREPRPVIIFQSFGESAVNLQFSVWTARDNYLDLRNGLAEDVREAFQREGIEIPYPHRAVITRTLPAPVPAEAV